MSKPLGSPPYDKMHMPQRKIPPLQPEHISDTARIFANRIELLYAMPVGGKVAEMGTYEGIFAGNILDICKPAELHLFDINTEPLIKKIRADSRVIVKQGDSSSNLAVYADNFFDWIYIDGDHGYDGVWKDAQVAKTKIPVGAFLAFNDYTLWSFQEMAEYGIPFTVNTLCNEGEFEVVAFAFQYHGYHDIVLRKLK